MICLERSPAPDAVPFFCLQNYYEEKGKQEMYLRYVTAVKFSGRPNTKL